jgi:hypothetical protein
MSHYRERSRARVDYMGRVLMGFLAFFTFGSIVIFNWFDGGTLYNEQRGGVSTLISVDAPAAIGHR